MENNPIDAVVLWVDGNDPKWQKEKNEWEKTIKGIDDSASGDNRFRDWDNLQYVFRGIEKNMPWVRRIHLVTCGHFPNWLNLNNPKIHLVKHSDIIPSECLPTFNSSAIELSICNIEGLAEQFVYFNDDQFVIRSTKEEDFFRNGLPMDSAIISPPPIARQIISNNETNNIGIINDYFSIKDIKKNIKKWISLKYGNKVLRTIIFSNFKTIIGIFEPHICLSLLKSELKELWDIEYSELYNTTKNKFRTKEDVTIWLVRQWQLLKGKFMPRAISFGHMYSVTDDNDEIINFIKKNHKMKVICLNDVPGISNFENAKEEINAFLNEMLPEKSSFEL